MKNNRKQNGFSLSALIFLLSVCFEVIRFDLVMYLCYYLELV